MKTTLLKIISLTTITTFAVSTNCIVIKRPLFNIVRNILNKQLKNRIPKRLPLREKQYNKFLSSNGKMKKTKSSFYNLGPSTSIHLLGTPENDEVFASFHSPESGAAVGFNKKTKLKEIKSKCNDFLDKAGFKQKG